MMHMAEVRALSSMITFRFVKPLRILINIKTHTKKTIYLSETCTGQGPIQGVDGVASHFLLCNISGLSLTEISGRGW